MNKFSEFTEVDRLTCAMLDGTISQDDFSRLDKILYKSADQRKRYLEIIRLSHYFIGRPKILEII